MEAAALDALRRDLCQPVSYIDFCLVEGGQPGQTFGIFICPKRAPRGAGNTATGRRKRAAWQSGRGEPEPLMTKGGDGRFFG